MGGEAATGLVQGAAPGFSGHDGPKLLTFLPGKVSNFGSLLHSRDLTVCSRLGGLSYQLGMLAYTVVLMLFLSADVFWPDGKGCDGGKNKQMCQLNTTLEAAKSEFRFLIAFILAGFVARSVGMWQRRRTNYASLCGNARNLNVQIAGLLPIDPGESDLISARQMLGRWVMLAFELAVLKSRGQIDSEEARMFLVDEGLLIEGEWEAMVPGDRHTTVFWWLQYHLARLVDTGWLTEQRLATLSESIKDMRAQANDLMSSLDRDAPFPYANLCGILVSV